MTRAISSRERYIVIAAAVVVAALALDRFMLAPLLNRQTEIQARKENLQREMERVSQLFKKRQAAGARWKEMVAGGLKKSAGEAENALLHAIRDWSQDAGMSLASVRPERGAAKGRALDVVVQVSGTGSMRAVSRFLWRAQSSGLPVRVVEAQIGARREGSDDLSLQVRFSSLYMPESAKPAAATAGTATPKATTTAPVTTTSAAGCVTTTSAGGTTSTTVTAPTTTTTLRVPIQGADAAQGGRP